MVDFALEFFLHTFSTNSLLLIKSSQYNKMSLKPTKIHAEKFWKAQKYDMNVNVKMPYERIEADSRDTLY